MKAHSGASFVALALATSVLAPRPARAAEAAEAESSHLHPEIVVTGHHADDRIDLPPATRVTVDAGQIATQVNALSVEDTLKYAPSLIVRKRHVGDNFAPVATRTSGLGSSARSLIYADGVLLSALIANNNGNGSPRWTLVAPEEISRIDVLYGPFSAAYAGNSIGTTINIITRQPDRFEASARFVTNVQKFDLYNTRLTLPTRQYGVSVGDRVGPLSLFAAFTRTDAMSQPVTVVTAATAPAGTTGALPGLTRLGAANAILGVGGLEHHIQDTWKLKTALDLGAGSRLSYLLGIWTDDTTGGVETYLSGTGGAPAYSSAFNSSVYARNALHVAHALTFEGSSPWFDWHVVGTSYRYAHDRQNTPSAALPGGFAGGAGSIQRQDGTGWVTFDAKAAWRPTEGDAHVLSLGAHADRYSLQSVTFAAANWLDSAAQGNATAASRGKTRTLALWVQDRLKITPALTLTVGGRQEWWRAWNGSNLASGRSLAQPERRFSGFSPKAALEWRATPDWTARLSLGQAWRMPTVGELYQATVIGTQLSNPNPGLRPERARSAELAVERRTGRGTLRLSLFDEVVDDALISQTSILTPGITSAYVQNVGRTRARGAELAVEQGGLPGNIEVTASLTYADAVTSANAALPGSVGKLLPGVPHWKASAALTWHPAEPIALTAAARYASRIYATIDNSDTVGHTYQGFEDYLVVDLRATFRVNPHVDFAVGVDNVGDNRYFLFHPFPQRSVTAELRWRY